MSGTLLSVFLWSGVGFVVSVLGYKMDPDHWLANVLAVTGLLNLLIFILALLYGVFAMH